MRAIATAVVICLLVFQQGVPAQTESLTGTVVDSQGAVVPGATVDLVRDGKIIATAISDARGEWKFAKPAPGQYQVRVTLAGFKTTTVRLTIGASAVSPLKVVLEPGAMTEQVTVTADGLAVNTSTTRDNVIRRPPPPPPPAAPTTISGLPAERVGGRGAGQGYAAGVAGGVMGARADFNTEAYDRIDENRFHKVTDEPLSTFSIDVDTASYANVRRFLNGGALPPADAVRIEELINYFRYTYPDPSGDAPFSVATEVSVCPWNPKHRLALVGMRSRTLDQQKTPPRNLVFLLDVSGSMMPPDKLPLVKTAMRMLADTLRPQDRVAIVVYAGATGVVLPSTPGDRKEVIQRAIAELGAGGSTNGGAGIQLAYQIASANFMKEGINRVILATDGDFNVGVTSQGELVRMIEEKRERGVFLSVLGVGTGNLKDSTMEKLADKGNGNYAYLDSLHEARRVLIAEAGATLVTVAKDVKIQVEFNPRTVGAYRLVGYENRMLKKEDFNDDKKDAGEIGAGHSVTALYEIVPPGEPFEGSASVDPLKYQEPTKTTTASRSDELMTVKVRYKAPDGDASTLLSFVAKDGGRTPSANLGFAAAVAEFGLLLRKSPFKGEATWTQARDLARQHRGEDPDGYRAEFIRLIDLAAALEAQGATSPMTRR